MEPLGAVLAFCVPMSDAPSPQAVVDAYVAAYNAHDAAGMAKVMSAKAVVRQGVEKPPLSGKSVVRMIDKNLFKAGSKVQLNVVRGIAASDMVSQIETYPSSDLDVESLSAYRVADGCIVEMVFSVDF